MKIKTINNIQIHGFQNASWVMPRYECRLPKGWLKGSVVLDEFDTLEAAEDFCKHTFDFVSAKTRARLRHGWCCRLRKNYANFSEWQAYAEMYGLHEKLGYKTPEAAWKANPLCEGSTNPAHFRKVSK